MRTRWLYQGLAWLAPRIDHIGPTSTRSFFCCVFAPSGGLLKQNATSIPGGTKTPVKAEMSTRIDIWTQEPLLDSVTPNETSKVRPHIGRAVKRSMRPNRAMPNP